MLTVNSRRVSLAVLFGLALPLLVSCGSSDDGGTGPKGVETQTASASISPSSATIARGGSTSVTVVYKATGGLVIGSSYGFNKQYEGISIDQTSSVTSGSTITTIYSVGADATVPTGTSDVRFSTPVSGYTGTGSVPTAIAATLKLTVTP